MKRTLSILGGLLLGTALAMVFVGCKPVSTTAPQTLAPGYLNQADQVMGETLVGAHAFYVTIQQDVAAGKYHPSTTEATSLNDFATALNAAQILYVAYHAGQATQAQAQTAVNAVATQQTALQATLTGAKQ